MVVLEAIDAEEGGDVGGEGVGVVVLVVFAVAGPTSPGRCGVRKYCCSFTRKNYKHTSDFSLENTCALRLQGVTPCTPSLNQKTTTILYTVAL